ncbi:unnamed protein product [Linum trigynum]|uniref:Retrotransposon gag domain-containing protein n=1 Tax=Linum trigynum TaxID=586398 RepID=A0AAV2GDQ8_9ROSI
MTQPGEPWRWPRTTLESGRREGQSETKPNGPTMQELENRDFGKAGESDEATAALFRGRTVTLKFPKFTGQEDLSGWMARVEKYLRYQDISEEHKVTLASFHMEDDANQWLVWIEEEFTQSGMDMTCEDFRAEFWKRYGSTDKAVEHEALAKIRQTGSVEDYQQAFERLLNRCRGCSKEAVMGTSMGGLKPEISAYIRAFEPHNTREANRLEKNSRGGDQDLARSCERRNTGNRGGSSRGFSRASSGAGTRSRTTESGTTAGSEEGHLPLDT